MKIILSVFALTAMLLIANNLWGQQPPLNATWKDSARIYIRELRDGAVVVRLRTRSSAIEKLRNAGDMANANTLRSEQLKENQIIVHAFLTEFNFCKVYFMFTDSTDALLNGKTQGFFLDQNLKIDPAITLDEKFFLIAEKGTPQLHAKYDPTQPDQEESERGYLNETLILLLPNLKSLKDPFPYYAQEGFPATLLPSDWSAKVNTMNKRLLAFYKKSL